MKIQNILENNSIKTLFQPVINLKERKIIGYEALSRGIEGDVTIGAVELFELAARGSAVTELDRLCRINALHKFTMISSCSEDRILFINMNVDIFSDPDLPNRNIQRLVESLGMDPGQVAIEIPEGHIENSENLRRFVGYYREEGFLIALDDVGIKHSNLSRLAMIKPDIIKIDKDLIMHIHDDFPTQQVAASLCDLGHRMGAMVVAEGVETEEQLNLCLEMDMDLIQGYYFSRPEELFCLDEEALVSRIKNAAFSYQFRLIEKLAGKENNFRLLSRKIQERIKDSTIGTISDYVQIMKRLQEENRDWECLYILEQGGRQISPSVLKKDSVCHSHFLFRPAEKGADHSLKSYFAGLQADSDYYVTSPYISMASGKRCCTLSVKLTGASVEGDILCIDIAVP